jgi:hypothetical protein
VAFLRRAFKCDHCGRQFLTRALRTVHEASECPQRPSVQRRRDTPK